MNAQLLNDIEQLSPESQQKIEAFIISMKELYLPKKTKLSEEEFVGMWGNRPEMQDSTEWVRNKRQPTITKGDKTIDPTEFFGMWKEQPKNLADIRKKAWQRSELNK
jgi:hypothetical protein